jgi:hypothetical protein
VNPTRFTSKGSPCPSCSAGDVDINDARRRITQHVPFEGLALDCESADRTRGPEELAHALYPRLLLLSPAVLAVSSLPRSTAERGRKRLTPTHRAGIAHRASPFRSHPSGQAAERKQTGPETHLSDQTTKRPPSQRQRSRRAHQTAHPFEWTKQVVFSQHPRAKYADLCQLGTSRPPRDLCAGIGR